MVGVLQENNKKVILCFICLNLYIQKLLKKTKTNAGNAAARCTYGLVDLWVIYVVPIRRLAVYTRPGYQGY